MNFPSRIWTETISPFGTPAIFVAINSDSIGGADELEDKLSSKLVFSKSQVEFCDSTGLISHKKDSRSLPYAIENLNTQVVSMFHNDSSPI